MALTDDLRKLLNLSHAIAWQGAGIAGKKPDEPGLVSAFLDPQIQNGLQTVFQVALGTSANARIDSIFTHKTPQVRPAGMTPVEIGDLLLIRQHFNTSNGSAQGKALLFQAKKNVNASSGTFTKPKDIIQYALYRNWPPFHGETRLRATPDAAAPLPTPAPSPWDFNQSNPGGRFGQYLAVFEGQAHTFSPPNGIGQETSLFSGSNYSPLGAGQPPPSKTTWANGPVLPGAALQEVVCPEESAFALSISIGPPFG